MGKIFYKGVDYSSPTSSGVSGVKGNKETVYRVGNVNITPENIGALAENGDSKDNTVTYTSTDATTADAWTDVAVLATGEKHSSLFAKISTMFKNIRYIYTHFIKSENILDTLEEISANTQSGKVAGALAVLYKMYPDFKFMMGNPQAKDWPKYKDTWDTYLGMTEILIKELPGLDADINIDL